MRSGGVEARRRVARGKRLQGTGVRLAGTKGELCWCCTRKSKRRTCCLLVPQTQPHTKCTKNLCLGVRERIATAQPWLMGVFFRNNLFLRELFMQEASKTAFWMNHRKAPPSEFGDTLHLRLPDGRPILFWVLVLVGACQSGTAWAGLCLIHHHHRLSSVVRSRHSGRQPRACGMAGPFSMFCSLPTRHCQAPPRGNGLVIVL